MRLFKRSDTLVSDSWFYLAGLAMIVLLITFSFTAVALIVERDLYIEPFVISVLSFILAKGCWLMGERFKKD